MASSFEPLAWEPPLLVLVAASPVQHREQAKLAVSGIHILFRGCAPQKACAHARKPFCRRDADEMNQPTLTRFSYTPAHPDPAQKLFGLLGPQLGSTNAASP